MTDRFKLTIDRRIWLRGEGESCLLDGRGKRCCVGIYLGALGWNDVRLHRASTADAVHCDSKPIPMWLGQDYCRSVDAQILYRINDLPLGEPRTALPSSSLAPGKPILMLDEGDRENRIAEVFARNGVDVEFVGP